MIEYYKFYLHKEMQHAPQPLFLGYTTANPPFDSRLIHPLKEYYIFKYTLSGCGIVSDGNRSWKLSPGSVMLLKFPNDRYHFFIEEKTEEWHSIYLEFSPGDLGGALMELIDDYGVVYELAPESKIIRLLLAYREKYQEHSMLKIEGNQAVYRNNIGINGLEGTQLIYRILTELQINDTTKRRLNHKLLNAACEYVNDNLSKKINIEEMAKQLGISRGHLMRVFSNRMGITLNRYIIIAKTRMACQLLTESNLSIDEISDKIGIKSNIYFYRMFKRETGMTPREFCNSDQQEEIIKSL